MFKYKSLFDLWKQSCEKYSDLVLFTDNKENVQVTYKQAFREVCFLAEKFKEFGIERFNHVCLFAINSPRWLIVEQAVITLGAVCVSKTSEINIKELDYVFHNSESCVLTTDNEEIIRHFVSTDENFLKNIKFVLYTGESSEFSEISKVYKLSDILSGLTEKTEVKTDWVENPEDTAYINYTSGTSSMPKGAMLPNVGMSYVAEQLQYFNDIKTGKTFVVTFPLSSAGGKSFNILCLSMGCRIMYTQYKEFYEVIEKYQPEYLHCAPKIMQTIHSKLIANVKERGLLFELIYNFSFEFSKILLQLERNWIYKKKVEFLKGIINPIKRMLDKTVYKKVRNSFIKDESIIFVGSAHLAKPLEDYFGIIGIPLVQHYGLTETTGLAVSNTIQSQKERPYTVGIAFEGTVISIIDPETHKELPYGQVGLITLGGPEIMKGYYKNPEATKKGLLENGYLNTGDLGYVDKDGYLVVLSRYDDVIVLSNGYNVYTPLLENEAKDSEFVNQLVIVGHGKPYMASLIVLDKEQYKIWCDKNNMKNIEPNKNEVFKKFLIEHINEKIKRKNDYRYYEKIKKVYFLKDEFTVENGMLTGTMKVKYRKICNIYQNEIEKLYEG